MYVGITVSVLLYLSFSAICSSSCSARYVCMMVIMRKRKNQKTRALLERYPARSHSLGDMVWLVLPILIMCWKTFLLKKLFFCCIVWNNFFFHYFFFLYFS
jgi:hypothetical protein